MMRFLKNVKNTIDFKIKEYYKTDLIINNTF